MANHKPLRRRRIVGMRFIGKFHNPEGRAVHVYVGNDCHTGEGVRFWYDGTSTRHFIDDHNFCRWKAAKPKL